MGFYVDLEMPKDCPMCPFAHYDDMFNTFRGCDITKGKRWAVKNDKDYAKLSTRPDWCPLIEIPPHGRLIDADAFDERVRLAGGMADEELSDDFKDGIQTTLLLLKSQRTVIEADYPPSVPLEQVWTEIFGEDGE